MWFYFIVCRFIFVQLYFQKENVYTIPNILCITRIAMSPYLGYTIFHEDYNLALGLLVFAGVTDVVSFILQNYYYVLEILVIVSLG